MREPQRLVRSKSSFQRLGRTAQRHRPDRAQRMTAAQIEGSLRRRRWWLSDSSCGTSEAIEPSGRSAPSATRQRVKSKSRPSDPAALPTRPPLHAPARHSHLALDFADAAVGGGLEDHGTAGGTDPTWWWWRAGAPPDCGRSRRSGTRSSRASSPAGRLPQEVVVVVGAVQQRPRRRKEMRRMIGIERVPRRCPADRATSEACLPPAAGGFLAVPLLL
jgi:hypothetical protein